MDYQKGFSNQTLILNDLFVTIENIIVGVSNIIKSTNDNFTEFKVYSQSNQPVVSLLYDNCSKKKTIYEPTKRYPDKNVVSNGQQHEETPLVLSKNIKTEPDMDISQKILFENLQLIKAEGNRNKISNLNNGPTTLTSDLRNGNSIKIVQRASNLSIKREYNNTPMNSQKEINMQGKKNRISGTMNKNLFKDEKPKQQLCELPILTKTRIFIEDSPPSVYIYQKNNSIEQKSHACNLCGETFETLSLKEKHEKENPDHKPYSCTYCKISLRGLHDKQIHERMHTEEKPFKCDFCEKSFGTIRDQKRHHKRHMGEKTYNCSFCNKSFTSPTSKQCHERLHTGERPHRCQFCDRTFLNFQHKKVHEQTHTGERPYKCDYCDMTFIQSSNKKNHEKIHIQDKPYKCSHCDQTFTFLKSKLSHEKFHKKEIFYVM